MSQDLRDEIDAIDAIYPGSVDVVAELVYNIRMSDRPDLTLQMRFPGSYPEQIPQILRVILLDPLKYPDTVYLEVRFREILERIFTSGLVCLFDLQIEIADFLDLYDADHVVPEAPKQEESVNSIPKPSVLREVIEDSEPITYTHESADPLDGWTQSDPISDRGSTFVAFVRPVSSVEQAQEHLDTLVSNRRIARSSHNMTAWRIKSENGVQFQDYDDDGESAAGSRLLHLLTMMDVWNVMVVVSRWFGGAHIGPDRFKHINSAARDAIMRGGFMEKARNLAPNKKKK